MKLPSTYRLPAAAAALAAVLALWGVPAFPLRAAGEAAPPAAPAPAPTPADEVAMPETPATPEPAPAIEAPTTPAGPVAPGAAVEAETTHDTEDRPAGVEHRDTQRVQELVTIMNGAHLRAGESTPQMVTIMGSAVVDGVVDHDCVTVMGNVTVNGKVKGQLVCIGGVITLGPGAEVRGEVVSVGGGVRADPSAHIRGQKVAVTLPGLGSGAPWVAEWFEDGLGKARVLPHNHSWAWGAAVFLVCLNVLFAAMFRGAVTASARAVEARPVFTFLNGALVLLFLPVLFVLLAVSIVGIPLLPVAVAGLFLCWFIGTIGIFCFCGQQFGLADRPVLAVLVGNLIFLLLYALPIVGFAVWSVTGLMGFGAAITALGNRRREAKEARAAALREEKARRAQVAPAPAVTPQVQVTPTTPVYMAPPAPVAAPQPPPMATSSMGFGTTEAPMAAAAPSPGTGPGASFVPPYSGWTPPAAPPPMPSAAPAVSVPPLPSDELNERATFWPRLLAALLDIFVVTMSLVFLGLMAGPTWVVALLAYHTFFWGWRGSTPGGIVLNLQVVRDDRAPMDYKVAGVRALSGVFSMVPAGLGLIWVAFDRDGQSWHDKLAGTSVICVRKSRPLV